MITSFDILDLVYSTLKDSALKASVSGGVYKLRRPDDSTKEDVVINVLPVTGDSVQVCVVNVNIHVSDLAVNIGGVAQFQPDTARMKALAAIAFDLLREKYGSDYNMYVEDQAIFPDERNQHFYNLRIRFRKHNSS